MGGYLIKGAGLIRKKSQEVDPTTETPTASSFQIGPDMGEIVHKVSLRGLNKACKHGQTGPNMRKSSLRCLAES